MKPGISPLLNSVLMVTLLAVSLLSHPATAAPQFKILHTFGEGMDAGGLWSGLIFDDKGNLFGASAGGGVNRYGTVYELKPQPDGTWKEKILHSFGFDDPDGFEPYDGVIRDKSGNLYATTSMGGAGGDRGTIFELSPSPGGWTLNVLYDFCIPPCSGAPGAAPNAGLFQDGSGNLYGVGAGVFELSSGENGWTETNLHDFCTGNCYDGHVPGAGLISDAKGTLYGTTEFGGKHNKGTVYLVKQKRDGTWTEHVLHHFGGSQSDGVEPGIGRLAMDNAGNLYGTTAQGGKHRCGGGVFGCGTVFRLSLQPDGHWKQTILHNFKPGSEGNSPGAGVVLDAQGDLYGTAGQGGGPCRCGVVYKLSPNPDGSWAYTLLHTFNGDDGALPDANLIMDDQGNLYGTASQGGPGTAGVAFEITP